jgi:hypothetical protein
MTASSTASSLSRRALLTGSAAVAGAAATAGLAAPAAVAAEPATADLYPLKPPHLLEAENLVEYLRLRADPWSYNRYDAPGENLGTTAVVWGRPGHPEEFGNLSQCASFVTSVLERAYGADTAYGWATRDYFDSYFPPKGGGPARTVPYPTAEDLQAGFADAAQVPHVDQVTKPVNLRPGDLVAVDYDAGATSAPYTGHVVMIRAAEGTFPSPVDARLGSGVVPYLFQIVDCTSNPHGGPDLTSQSSIDHYRAHPDTRAEISDDNTTYAEHSGAGYGHMIFYADPVTQLFAGYRWSVNSSDPIAATAVAAAGQQQIAAARVNAFTV